MVSYVLTIHMYFTYVLCTDQLCFCLFLPILLNIVTMYFTYLLTFDTYGAFTLDVKSVLDENLGGILGGTQR
jgi:hypothetical protein